MADLTVSTDIDTFMGAADFAAARTALGVPGLATANTFSAAGAASAPAMSLTGLPYTAGTATTTKPLLLLEPTGTTSTGWATTGTMLGVNAPSGFLGSLIDAQKNGISSFLVNHPTAQKTRMTISYGVNGWERAGFEVNSAFQGLVFIGRADTLNGDNPPVAIGDSVPGLMSGVVLNGAGQIGWCSTHPGYATDVNLGRHGAANLRLGKIASNTPLAQTFTIGEAGLIGGTADRPGGNGTLQSGLGTGTGTASSLVFQTPTTVGAGSTVQTYTTRLTLDTNGATVSGNIIFAAGGSLLSWGGRSKFQSPADGILQLSNAAQTDFSRLQFGGTTNAFPALRRSSSQLDCVLADASAFAKFAAHEFQSQPPTGGTAAAWKLGIAAAVTPTSPNRTIEVEIGGTTLYIHAKTTNN